MVAASKAFYLVVISLATAFTACGAKVYRRSLAQESVQKAGSGNSSATLDSAIAADGVTTVAIEIVERQCTISAHSYIDPFASGSLELLGPAENLSDTAEECCRSCQAHEECNAWQWCPRAVESGCTMNATTTSAAVAFPHLGCQLMHIPASVLDGDQTRQQGPEVPFVSGAPLNLTLAQVEGYTIKAGADLAPRYDYICAGTIDPEGRRCLLQGETQEVADRCNADRSCEAFVYYPRGLEFDGSGAVGVLKTSHADLPLGANVTFINPTSAVYMKEENALRYQRDAAALDGIQTAVIVVAAVLGSAVLAAAFGGFGAWYLRRHHRMQRSSREGSGGSVGSSEGHKPEAAAAAAAWTQGLQLEGSAGTDRGDEGPKSRRPGQDSPPSVFDTASGRGTHGDEDSASTSRASTSSADAASRFAPYAPQGGTTAYDIHNVVVSELGPGAVPSFLASSGARSGTTGTEGSTARELLDVFSKMYRQRPAADATALAQMFDCVDAERQRQGEGGPAEPAEPAEPVPTAAVEERAERWPPQQQRRQEHSPAETLQWSIRPEQVELCRRADGTLWHLGSGAFGTVIKGAYHGPQGSVRSVAVKVLHQFDEPRRTDEFVREAKLLRSLQHAHIVQFLGACMDAPLGTAMLVTELLEAGDLWRALGVKHPDTGERVFAWHARGRLVLADVAHGLLYLHSKRIVHLDLKSANILLTRSGKAKIADVGMARVLQNSCLSALSGLGTFAWSAPEVLTGRRCSERADIFSYGVVLWEICTGEMPVRGDMRALRVPEECPAEVADLYLRCTAEDPSQRPSAADILDLLVAAGGASAATVHNFT